MEKNIQKKTPDPFYFVAADVGNARIKLGLFDAGVALALPEPLRTLPLVGDRPALDDILPWLADSADAALAWRIASVNRPAASRLLDWIETHRPADRVVLLASGDLPLVVGLPRPDMVGIDRLVDAVAVNRLREPNRPAAIVDVGSAITVDWVSADGVFRGGAILPGIQMSARALCEFTDLLPLVSGADLDGPPPAVGRDTESAIASGLFWGAVGAIRQLVDQMGGEARPQIFLPGGAGAAVAELLDAEARHVPHLTLAGIALAAWKQREWEAPQC